jgi:hypothetical protein
MAPLQAGDAPARAKMLPPARHTVEQQRQSAFDDGPHDISRAPAWRETGQRYLKPQIEMRNFHEQKIEVEASG